MASRIASVAIEVADLERSERFYTATLGLGVIARIEAPGVKEVIVGDPEGGAQLMLAHRDEPQPVGEPAGIWKVFVWADDVAGVCDAAVAAGAKLVAPPVVNRRFGLELAMVEDPDGYLVELGARIAP